MRDYNETISLLPLFAGIEPAELDGMLTCLNSCVRQYKKDQYILLNDEPVVNIGIVVRGSVETIREDLWGTRTPVAELRSGEIFGERYEVTRTPSSNIYFRAMTDSVILLMPFERAVHLCSMACVAHYKLVENLTSMISEKNRRLQEKIDRGRFSEDAARKNSDLSVADCPEEGKLRNRNSDEPDGAGGIPVRRPERIDQRALPYETGQAAGIRQKHLYTA